MKFSWFYEEMWVKKSFWIFSMVNITNGYIRNIVALIDLVEEFKSFHQCNEHKTVGN